MIDLKNRIRTIFLKEFIKTYFFNFFFLDKIFLSGICAFFAFGNFDFDKKRRIEPKIGNLLIASFFYIRFFCAFNSSEA